jgi:hypothetical protein
MQWAILSAFWIQSGVNSVRQHKINMIEDALTLFDRTHEESAKVELRKFRRVQRLKQETSQRIVEGWWLIRLRATALRRDKLLRG